MLTMVDVETVKTLLGPGMLTRCLVSFSYNFFSIVFFFFGSSARVFAVMVAVVEIFNKSSDSGNVLSLID